MKAWRGTWSKMPDVVSIIVAETRSRAKRTLLGQICEAGYQGEWTELTVRRAPEFDGWAGRRKTPETWHCWDEDVVKEMCVA